MHPNTAGCNTRHRASNQAAYPRQWEILRGDAAARFRATFGIAAYDQRRAQIMLERAAKKMPVTGGN